LSQLKEIPIFSFLLYPNLSDSGTMAMTRSESSWIWWRQQPAIVMAWGLAEDLEEIAM
jgi:hypothetical protein